MADDFASNDKSSSGRNKQDSFFCGKTDDISAKASSSFTGNEHEHMPDESLFHGNDLFKMDYFAAPSITQPEMGNSFEISRKADSPILTNPEFDWIEPSDPIRSCVIVTSEEDESSSRSCSSDSREGHVLREKEVDPHITEFTIGLKDVPTDTLQELHAESSGAMDDGEGNKAPWRHNLGGWLWEAGSSCTFLSLALAAAVIGLVIVGSGWKQVCFEFQKLRCRRFLNRKGISQVMYQLVQVKGSSSKVRKIPVIRAKSSSLNL